MSMIAGGLSLATNFLSGFLFGNGYGAGVRMGYEDLYPLLKGNASGIANLLHVPYASSGFKLATGMTGGGQTSGLQVPAEVSQPMGMATPDQIAQGNMSTNQSSYNRTDAVGASYGFPKRGDIKEGFRWIVLAQSNSGPQSKYRYLGTLYQVRNGRWEPVGYLNGYKPIQPYDTRKYV